MLDSRNADLLEPDRLFTRSNRRFVRAQVPRGEHQGLPYTIAQPLVGRYEPHRYHASAGRYLFLDGVDQKTGAPVLIKCILRHDIEAPAHVRDREGVTNHLRGLRKALEAERRILVLLRNSGCCAIPHPSDFVFDANPALEGPFPTEDLDEWQYDDAEMVANEPYLILKASEGDLLKDVLKRVPEHRFSEGRSLQILHQVAGVLRAIQRPLVIRPGMTWQLVYQDLRPANVLLGPEDQVTLLNLDRCQLTNRDTGLRLLAGEGATGYCPPEVERPQATLTPAADVYTVGVLFFQMLTGRGPLEFPPLGAGPMLGAGSALGAGLPTPALGAGLPTPPTGAPRRAVQFDLRLLEGVCRPATRQLIVHCLATDPTQRPVDAEAVWQALDALLQSS
jgi:serine/threonine protein kinase